MATSEYRNDLINAAIGVQRLNNEQLARLTGLNVNTISAIRNGKPTVSVPTLRRVAEALGIPMADLFKRESEQGLGQVQVVDPTAAIVAT
jgi:transcriptional regulator with XRE-family HTH domain